MDEEDIGWCDNKNVSCRICSTVMDECGCDKRHRRLDEDLCYLCRRNMELKLRLMRMGFKFWIRERVKLRDLVGTGTVLEAIWDGFNEKYLIRYIYKGEMQSGVFYKSELERIKTGESEK